MYTISMSRSSKSIINHIKYKLNEQLYIETVHPAHCQSVNIDWPVRCCNPLWEGRTRATATAASWAMTRRASGVLSSHECKTHQLLKGKFRDNVNSGAAWVYKWQKIFAPIPLCVCDENLTAKKWQGQGWTRWWRWLLCPSINVRTMNIISTL